MGIYRSRNNRKRWRLNWPWSWLFPLKVDERFCRECSLPYHEGPLPSSVHYVVFKSISALVYPAGSWRSEDYEVRLGRMKRGGRQLFHSEFIPVSEIDDVITALLMLKEDLSKLRPTNAVRRV